MKVQESFKDENIQLYIVSTPIGNLSDITFRALATLKSVDLILCEDTRVTIKLLRHYDISTPLESYQKFNEKEKLEEIIEFLKEGKRVALVSDAGTPLVNDPGFILVKEAIEHEIPVIAIPGASSILTSLVASGLLPQPFTFVGFLPRKQSEARFILERYKGREETLVFFESPLRISKTLEEMYDVLGDRRLVLARELTKKFETFYRGSLKTMKDAEFDTRGEYVILLEGEFKKEEMILDIVTQVNLFIEEGLSEKEALKKVAKMLGVHKSEVYKAYKIVKPE
ncbi:16S rRNA (cytidine(1402)-2'-O)-methyltransferase [Acholeplasma equirhinis]|uniref:16S rRNA (cytidine(1402)-2'-O)-methyltransferase n=1 Tax=Acholeplasma equirhinis TaxID=555393 RepID=UPI00197A9FA8|nr:16S rRNA (cytidine(1402)-2'-O)-methyltransferase [Acholeplasma equirhinis]MBN3490912.1 16S rRNA (cytidine(1402)-2'-O)-methyltransferase [Acholeplasma equirhinis]